jgi:glycosyltransferase involved in cell wall biosynthesis
MTVRVVHVSSHYPPFLGGLEKVVQSLARYRSERELPVDVFTSELKGHAHGDAGFVSRLKSFNIAHTAIMPSLPRKLLQVERDSVVHLHVAQAYAPEAVLLARLVKRLPYIAHVHIDVGPSGPAGALLHIYKPFVLGRVLRRAETVVVFTEEQRQTMQAKYRIDPQRIAVIPNGVERSFYSDVPRSLHARPRLLFVGRLAIQKNIPFLLHALDGISDRFDTTLVGDGELAAESKELARRLGLQNITFFGRADGTTLLDLYREADIFVLPSEREGMPLVLLEAMAMGLPIVATDIPGNRDVVIEGENGRLVPLNDVAALRSTLLRMVAEPADYVRMSRSARSLAQRFSWDVVGEEFETLYARAGRYKEPAQR